MGEKWVICPVCGGKTRVRLREDTGLINFPLFCPKCKCENIISAEHLRVKVQKTVHTSV